MRRLLAIRDWKYLAAAAISAALYCSNVAAADLIDRPPPLPAPVKLTIAAVNQGHIAAMQNVGEKIAGLNVDLEFAQFVRFADARTALATGAVDIATVGPGDLPIALSQDIETFSILTGVGSSARYVIQRKGIDLETWSDLRGKRLGIPSGSATWMQFAAKLQDVGLPYDSFEAVNIQGGGPNFIQALRDGEVDGILMWEPFESEAGATGIGSFATHLDYSTSSAVGAELGVIAASSKAIAEKREALRRFLWGYLTSERELANDRAKFAAAIAAYTGVDLAAATRMSERLKLGGVITLDQLKAQAAFMFKSGIITKDVTDKLAAHYDTSLVSSLEKQ